MTSVNTNMGALHALQNLNASSRDLSAVQNRINSGLKVAGPKDDGAVFNIAQDKRASHRVLDAVRTSLNRAKSIADVGLAAGEQLSDLFIQMREKAVAAADRSISATTRTAYNQEFIVLRDQVASIINNAVFDGGNVLNGSAASFTFPANATGTLTVQLPVLDLRLAAPGSTPNVPPFLPVSMQLQWDDEMDTQARAVIARERVTVSLEFINAQLSRLAAAAKRIENHEIFLGRLQDSIKGGIGNMVDADLSVEAANLQAAQVRQQLGTQALSIANSAPQSILSLFRT